MIALLALGLATADARVQAAAEQARAEAVVVLEVATGRTVARTGKWDKPLPPGSTFKLVAALAADGKPEALAAARCGGRARQAGVDVVCWDEAGHGELDLEEGIAQSCNVYFGAVGERLGAPAILAEARALGLGAGGLPRDDAPGPWVADGRGVLLTAVDEASLARQIASGRRADGKALASATLLARIRRGMRAAVEHGTAKAAASSVAVAGKTGTTIIGRDEIGWFIGYAPAEEPTVALAIARRGMMGKDVAKLAPAIFDAWFHGR